MYTADLNVYRFIHRCRNREAEGAIGLTPLKIFQPFYPTICSSHSKRNSTLPKNHCSFLHEEWVFRINTLRLMAYSVQFDLASCSSKFQVLIVVTYDRYNEYHCKAHVGPPSQ